MSMFNLVETRVLVRQDALRASLEEGNDLLFGSSLCEI